MKKKKKSALARAVLGPVCLIAVGLILLLNPDIGSAAISTILGWMLVAAGGLGGVVCIFSWPICGIPEVIVSVLALGLGIYILVNPLALASILGIGLGIFLVIQGSSGVAEAFQLKRCGYSWMPNLVLALLTLGLGAVLIFAPLTTSRIVMIICGAAMMLCGVVSLILRARAAKRLQGYQDSNIIDADQ